jgi:hypothetical protein
MKAIFGISALLVVLCVVGVLKHKQLQNPSAITSSAASAGISLPVGANQSEQSQNIEQQIKKRVEDEVRAHHAHAPGDD